jgi:HlyD family secretion protein
MTSNAPEPGDDIGKILGAGRRNTRRWRWLATALAALLLAALGYFLVAPDAGPQLHFVTAKVKSGDLTVTVTATGTLQPVNQVDVGSELSGTIEEVFVDFNDRVERDQLLARLDTDRLRATVTEARASLASARARREEAQATVEETRLRYERCQKLAARQLCTGEDLDTARAAQARARAAEASATALVAVAQATLEAAETDLAKAEIRSPIDGLVLQRQIEPGQTVAASLQAPVLFTLAENLTQMELHVAVDEADIGKVEEGQSAIFTVDAYADRSFPALITQVRFAPQIIEGVVTYETVLAVDNADLALRPGMTATAVVTVQQLSDVALLPNAALRFTPPEKQTAQRSGGGIFGALFRRPHSSRRRPEAVAAGGQKVWVLRNGQPEAVVVKPGASDGRFTELPHGDLQPGMDVIIDAVAAGR